MSTNVILKFRLEGQHCATLFIFLSFANLIVWECVRTGCVRVWPVLLQMVVFLIISWFSVPDALLGSHTFNQMLTVFTLQDCGPLLKRVLTAESFHVLNWVSVFIFLLIKLQFYFEVISLDVSRSKAQYYILQIWLAQLDTCTRTHAEGKGRNPPWIINLCFSFVRYFLKSWYFETFSMCQALCETFYVLSHEMLELSLWQSYYS